MLNSHPLLLSSLLGLLVVPAGSVVASAPAHPVWDGAECGTMDRLDAHRGKILAKQGMAKDVAIQAACEDNPRPTYDDEKTYSDDDYGFTIHYTTNSADDAAITEADIAVIAQVMIDVIDAEQGDMGFLSPPDDSVDRETYCDEGFGGDGGSGNYDIYFINDDGLYGYAQPMSEVDGEFYPSTSFLVLSTWILDVPGALEITVAHEFFHSVQFTYDSWESAGWMESSATWMEEQVYDEFNGYFEYLEDAFNSPELPIDTFDNRGVIQYGNAIWPLYLTQSLPQSYIRDVWEGCGSFEGENVLEVFRSSLDSSYDGGFSEAILDFRSAMVNTSEFEEGASFPDVFPWDSGAIEDHDSVEYTGAHIIELLPPAETGPLTVCYQADDSTTLARVLGIGSDGSVSDLGNLDSGGEMTVDVGGDTASLTLVVANGNIEDSGDYSYGSSEGEECVVDEGCGCNGAGSSSQGAWALMLLGLIGLRRRS